MAKKLLIVESPAKAKTIEKYLGKDFRVKSSFGHIRDLEKGTKGIDIKDNFKPNYIISPEKVKVVSDLKKEVSVSDEVWLATDEDREGEAISWHLCEVLGLNPKSVKRIVFREITKPAIQKAIVEPRNVDLNLVNAQQARRVLDRLVGFELSEILWRKVKNKLSAGRVQSVAVKLVVEKEREIQEFVPRMFFKVEANFHHRDKSTQDRFKAVLNEEFNNKQDAQTFLELCKRSQFSVANVEVKPGSRSPAPPFITSTLQQEASRKLGFSVNRTMGAAQRLYEAGFISYMRTDSPNLSEMAMQAMAEEIKSSFGNNYLHTRQYKSKSNNAQEAHEAIRPTYMNLRNAGETSDQQRLYELIWKRAMASQMAAAKIEKTIISIAISEDKKHLFLAEGEVILFDGFLKVYMESSDDDDAEKEGMLPLLKVHDPLTHLGISATEKYTKPVARYTEASLVKKLEELGIGRPSTYAPTISKIMEEGRGYVVKESREGAQRKYIRMTLSDGTIKESQETETVGATKNVLYPTATGAVVCDYLSGHFAEIMNYGFTAEIEKDFDEIAEGQRDWQVMIDSFYWPFHKTVESVMEQGERAKGRRELGIDPATGRKVLAQLTRFGPVIQIGDKDELPEGEKPKFASLRPGQNMETISMKEAMDLFHLPKDLGTFEGQTVTIGIGRFGPYVKVGEKFISLPKGSDPLSVDLDQAIAVIKAKEEEDAPIGYYQEMPVTKGKGRFGPFVKWNGLFVNIPKRIDFDKLTLDQAIPLIDSKSEKEANRYIHNWPELKLSVENGRWGPYMKFKTKMISLPKVDGEKITSEMAANMSLDQFKAFVEAQIPGAFASKTAVKKSPEKTVKTAAKKSNSTSSKTSKKK